MQEERWEAVPELLLLGLHQCGSCEGSFQFDLSVILVVLEIIVTGYNISVLTKLRCGNTTTLLQQRSMLQETQDSKKPASQNVVHSKYR